MRNKTFRFFPGEHCGLKFKSVSAYDRHFRINHTNDAYRCDKCGKAYGDLAILKHHLKNVHSEGTFYCEICSKKFGSLGYLKGHKRLIHSARQHKCDFPGCTKVFAKSGGLKRHLASHTEIRSFFCKICHSSYKYE